MKLKLKTYCKEAGRLLVSCIYLLGFSILASCVSYYHIDYSQSLFKPTAPYASFWFLNTKADEPHMEILKSIDSGLESNFQVWGLKKDSLKPDLLFISRWETHLVARYSSSSNREIMQTYSITNPVYSPFENTSDRLKSNSSEGKIRYHDEESFYRIQAIDAIKNELVWTVKVYPHKKKGLQTEHIPQMIKELTLSFAHVQFSDYKIKK